MTPRSSPPTEHERSSAELQASSFLLRHGARRLHPASWREPERELFPDDSPAPQPTPAPAPREPGDEALAEALAQAEPDSALAHGERQLHWEEERVLSAWKPLEIKPNPRHGGFDWHERTLRFVASCDVGREVAWLRDTQGNPAPLRLAQVGALSLRASIGRPARRELRRPWARMERVVALAADRFEWDQVEEWSALLASRGFRLLIVPPQAAAPAQAQPADWKLSRAASQARSRTLEEALRLERHAIRATPFSSSSDAAEGQAGAPVIVSGPLALRRGAFEPGQDVAAICTPRPILPPLILPEWRPTASSSAQSPNTPRAAQECEEDEEASIPRPVWRALYELRAGQRTPAWRCEQAVCPLVCWFVRLHAPASGSGSGHGSPLSGVVRVEVRRELWANQASREQFADGLSGLLLEAQARGQRLWPSERATQHLRALLTPLDALEARFARLCGL